MNFTQRLLSLSLLGALSPAVYADGWPQALPDNAATTADVAKTVYVLSNDTGDGLTLVHVNDWTVEGGRAVLDPDKQSLTYTPKAGFTGNDYFWYTFEDNQGRKNAAKVTVYVTANNDVEERPEAWPTAKADSYPLRLASSDSFGLLGNVLLNDDGVGLRVTSVNEYTSNGGMVKISDDQQSLSYKSLKPSSEWPYTDTFWYVLTDNWGRTNSAKVTLTVDYSATPEAWPQANLDSESTFVNTPVVVNVLANDVGEGLSLKSVNESTTKWGRVVINGDKLTYTPRYNYTGSDEFWYVFEDAWGRANSSKVTVNVSRNLSVARIPLNDTGVTTCGDYTGQQFSNEANHDNALGDCTAATDSDGDNIPAGQDATIGRDATSADYSDGEAGFSFTKLDASGNNLPATAASWSCVKDNHTGLIWESKQGLGRGTGNDGLHSADDKYFWYSTDPSINGGIEQVTVGSTFRPADCHGNSESQPSTYCSTEAFVNRVNGQGLCGLNNWRLPDVNELLSLVNYDKSFTAHIDGTFFPDTVITATSGIQGYATLSLTANPTATNYTVMAVNFSRGQILNSSRSDGYPTRLVNTSQLGE